MAKLRTWRVVFSILVIVSLGMNVLLVWSLLDARQRLRGMVSSFSNEVAAMTKEPFIVNVAVDQEIPVHITVPIDQTMAVPIEMEYPFSTVVTTYINLPLVGRQEIVIPVEGLLPISRTVQVPVQITLPISFTYHLQTELPVSVEIPPRVGGLFEKFLLEMP